MTGPAQERSADVLAHPLALEHFQLAPAVDDVAEQHGGGFGIVDRRVRLAGVERATGGLHRLAQHGLAVGEAAQGGGIEAAEGVERVALVAGTAHRGIDETEIERGVVAHQDRTLAAVVAHGGAHRLEHVLQREALVQGAAQRVVRVDAGDLQRARVEVGAGEGLHVGMRGGLRVQEAVRVHAHGDRGDLQQGIAFGVETAGFHVHDHRQEAAEARGHAARHAVVRNVHRRSISAAARLPAGGMILRHVFILSCDVHASAKIGQHAATRSSLAGRRQPGAWAAGIFEAKRLLCEGRFSTIRRPIVVLWGKKRRKDAPHGGLCSPNDFCRPGSRGTVEADPAITTVEKCMHSKTLALAIAAGLGLTSFAASAAPAQKTTHRKAATATVSADEVAQLKAQLAALQEKVDELQAQSNAQTEAQSQTAQAVQQVQAKQETIAAAPSDALSKRVDALDKLVNDTTVSGKMYFDFSNIDQKNSDTGKTA